MHSRSVLKLMTQAVERYEGTVSLVTADGIFALFGAPLANEDHAERASHAALEIHQAVESHAKELSATVHPSECALVSILVKWSFVPSRTVSNERSGRQCTLPVA